MFCGGEKRFFGEIPDLHSENRRTFGKWGASRGAWELGRTERAAVRRSGGRLGSAGGGRSYEKIAVLGGAVEEPAASTSLLRHCATLPC